MELLSPKQVAKALNVAESTVYGWTRKRILPHYKLGACIRFRMDEILDFVERQKVEADGNSTN